MRPAPVVSTTDDARKPGDAKGRPTGDAPSPQARLTTHTGPDPTMGTSYCSHSLALTPLWQAVGRGAALIGVHLGKDLCCHIVEFALVVLPGHSDTVRGVAFSPVDHTVASASWDNTIRLWGNISGNTLSCFRILNVGSQSHSITWSPCGSLVVPGTRTKDVQVWDIVRAQRQWSLSGHTNTVWCVAFAPVGMILASGSWDHTIRVWDLSLLTGKRSFLRGNSDACIAALHHHRSYVYSLSFSPCGKRIASGGEDGDIHISCFKTHSILGTLKGHTRYVHTVAYTHSTTKPVRLVSGGSDGSIRIWDTSKFTMLKLLIGHTGYVSSVTITLDDRYVISGSEDHSVRVWRLKGGECVDEKKGHAGAVLSVAVSSNNKFIVSSSGRLEFGVKLWSFRKQGPTQAGKVKNGTDNIQTKTTTT